MRISRNARKSLLWGYGPALAAFVMALLLTDIPVWALILLAWIGAALLTLVVAAIRSGIARRTAAAPVPEGGGPEGEDPQAGPSSDPSSGLSSGAPERPDGERRRAGSGGDRLH
jgi:hypothetical protein